MTDEGQFNKKDIVEIREDLRQTFLNELEQDISLRQNSPIQQIIDAAAIEMARQWDAIEDSYYSSFYQDAKGNELDKQLALAGFSREELRPATGEVTFSRDSPASRDITISEGTIVKTPQTETRPGIPFETTERATIFNGATEVSEVPIKAVAPWDTDVPEEYLGETSNVNADVIDEFQSGISGVDSVTNPLATGKEGAERFQEGRDRETDAEFKLRYENALAEGGVSTVPAMEASIFQFDDRIQSVRVEQIRDSTDGYGPEVTVFTPEIQNNVPDGEDIIAQAVFASRAAGLESFGNVTGQAETEDGRIYHENFNYATEVTVEIDAALTVSDLYPDDGDTRMKDSLVRFIGGVDTDDVSFPGLEIGDDVVHDQVKRRIMEIPGVVEADVNIGESGGSLSNTNISIETLEVAQTDLSEVTINVG